MTKAERTRQFIIETSAPIFNTKGIAATAYSDVMQATKMAKGGLYGHFESKDQLSAAVVDYNLNKLVEKVQQAIGSAATAKDKLFAWLDAFKAPTQFPVEGGCPLLNFGTESDDTNQLVRGKVKTVIEMAQKTIAAIVQQGIKNGEFKETFNGKEFSIKMFSLMEGGTLIGRVLNTNSQMTIIINLLKKEITSHLRP